MSDLKHACTQFNDGLEKAISFKDSVLAEMDGIEESTETRISILSGLSPSTSVVLPGLSDRPAFPVVRTLGSEQVKSMNSMARLRKNDIRTVGKETANLGEMFPWEQVVDSTDFNPDTVIKTINLIASLEPMKEIKLELRAKDPSRLSETSDGRVRGLHGGK